MAILLHAVTVQTNACVMAKMLDTMHVVVVFIME